ncbi:MAG TPA: TRAM domain-containing protein, partial [Blastocatellia bacterium]|nr:TRAM domain-containing protein [Blastocatellia bacterium]
RRKNQRLVGQTVTVLLEGYSAETDVLLRGRMESQAPEIDGHVLLNEVPDGLSLQPGDFLRVQITRALDHDLIGRVVGVEERARSLSPGVRLAV